MIKNREEMVVQKIEVDLRGPEGNAWALLALAGQLGRSLDMEKNEILQIKEDMISGDYEHLVDTFDRHFGDFVVLYR